MARVNLTGQEIISILATQLRVAFSTTEIVKIYKNKPLQNVNPPYIVLSTINAVETKELRGRGEKVYIIDIRIHPKVNESIYTWGITMAEKVIEAISYITIDELQVKTYSVESNITDDVLHVIVNYSFKIRYRDITGEPEYDTMEELIHTEGVK